MASNTNTTRVTIYVPLLGEGVPVLRPTEAIMRRDGVYEVLATPDYDPEDEVWEFPPGTLVCCQWEERGGEKILVARRRPE